VSANTTQPKEISAMPGPQSRARVGKFILFLLSIAFSAAIFLVLDWFHTAKVRRTAIPFAKNLCRVADPVRHHAFKPNCTDTGIWGRDSYDFSTNSLGFRDEKVREVPLTDVRPRVLMLGDSFTEGKVAWRDSYVGRIAAALPQYDLLNGGVSSYSPSNYLNTTRMVLAKGVEIDEVIVFIDLSDVQDEAAFYRDVDVSGAVAGPARQDKTLPWYAMWRIRIAQHLLLTDRILESLDRQLVRYGFFGRTLAGLGFDTGIAAWTYRKVDETDPYIAGYAPLGVEGGIAKEKAKMTLLWQELEKRNIPISVVVYPWPAQLAYDTVESRQVRIWREWCAGKCKRFISLFPAFFAVKDQCPRSQPGCWYLDYFIFGDVHFNAAGNALVADAVSDSLRQEQPSKRPQPNRSASGQPAGLP
jgi:hypothetical protein